MHTNLKGMDASELGESPAFYLLLSFNCKKKKTSQLISISVIHLGKLLQAPGREQRMAVKARAERKE